MYLYYNTFVVYAAGYHWDTSDWDPNQQQPSSQPSAAGGGKRGAAHTMPRSHRGSHNPDNDITIDPDNDYSYTDLQDEDEFIDSEFVGDSEFTENEAGSDFDDTGDDLDDIDEFDVDHPIDYKDIIGGDLTKYLPQYSDIEPSQNGAGDDSNWGSRENELNANFESANDLTGGDAQMHYGFSLQRPPRHHQRHNKKQYKPDNRFSGDFSAEYERRTGAIPMDELSVAPYASVSSIGNVCEIEDSEANLSDSDSSNTSMRLVKSSTNVHALV